MSGTSMENGWILAESQPRWGPQKHEYSLSFTLRHMFFMKRDVSMQLIGGRNRNLWARMNSNERLWQHSSVEPNVEVVFGDSGTVTMDNYFLSFRGARDINAYEELLWNHAWADTLKLLKHQRLTRHLTGPAIQQV